VAVWLSDVPELLKDNFCNAVASTGAEFQNTMKSISILFLFYSLSMVHVNGRNVFEYD
jgi:hypothetical protein